MKKRISAALVCGCLALSLALPVGAAQAAGEQEAVQVVNALGIMVGDQNGDMRLDAPVTRAEFITMAVKAAPGGGQVGRAATSPYPDVPWTHWAAGYVEAGVAAGLISGYSDGTFRPTNRITLAEGATIALRLLGYGPEDFSGAYPTGQLAKYRSLQLDPGLWAAAAGDQLTRRDAMYLFYNLMTAKTKEGGAYLNTLGYALNGAGQIDLVSLLNDAMEGPVVAVGSWQGQIPMDLTAARVYRGGAAASLSSVEEYDVVYYNRGMNTLWVYHDRVTGSIQALEPSASAPTSVTVAGRTCAIDSAAAAYDLSDLGRYALGDTVTLLLGRGGNVAAVVGPEAASAGSVRVGLVTAVDSGSYSDGKGGTYQARTATVLATDGRTYQYQDQNRTARVGALVQAVTSDQGTVTLKGLSTVSLSGKVSADGAKVGGYPLARDAEILDVSGEQGVRIYPARLAGVQLSGGQVKYYTQNSAGEIDKLILNDVTGDMHHYGILTEVSATAAGELSSYYAYTVTAEGQTVSLPASTTKFPVEKGPVQIKGALTQPEKLLPMTEVRGGTAAGGRLTAGGKSYLLADNVAVYTLKNGVYYQSTLSRVQESGGTLSGWYDKAESAGGRIRVLVAREG